MDDSAWGDSAWGGADWGDAHGDDADWDAALAVIVADGPLDGPSPATPATDLHSPPGAGLCADLERIDPRCLDTREAIAYARAAERAIAWLQARQSLALVAIAGPRPQVQTHIVDASVITIEDAARSEVSAALRWSESMAHGRITTARLLAGPLAITRRALESGDIGLRHAEAITAAAGRLSGFGAWLDPSRDDDGFAEACADLERAVLPTARTREVAATRRSAERALTRIDADHAERRRQQAHRSRDVWIEHEPDGMALLMARLGVAEAHACLSAVVAATSEVVAASAGVASACVASAGATGPSSAAADADRSRIGEQRADALTRLLLHEPPAPPASSAARPVVRTHVDVVIDLATLIGIDDHPGRLTARGPGGPQPVAAEVVRELVRRDASATMRRLVTDPLTGHLLDRGRSTYAVPDALRAFITLRDGTCRFPGCNRRAELGQIDHARAWADGGRTDVANLGVLCVRHHQLKTHAGWGIVASAADGSARWRAPSGATYDRPLPRLLSDG